MYYPARIKAGQPFRIQAGGRVILVDSTGVAEGIDITPMRGGQELRTMPKRQKAFKCIMDFDAVIIEAAVDCDIGLFLSTTDVSLGFADGMMLKVTGDVGVTNDPNNPLPVSLQDGVVNVTATNVGISNEDADAVPVRYQALTTINDQEPVAVGVVSTSLVNDPTLRKLRIRNGHPTALVCVGGENVTLSNAAIQLRPGDIWLEEDAAGAHWYAVSDTPGTPVQVQVLK